MACVLKVCVSQCVSSVGLGSEVVLVIMSLLIGSARLTAQDFTSGDAVHFTTPYICDAQYPHHFVNQEGRHLFVLNKTAWTYFVCQHPEAILRKAKSQGITVLRVTLEGTPYFKVLGLDLWPWGGTRQNPDWSTFNDSYWNQVEDRIRLAGRYGIALDIVLYFTLKPEVDDFEAHKPYLKLVADRLSRHPNVLLWEIMNEHTANEAFQDSAASFLKANDRFAHPVCSSDGTTDDALWPDKPWMDVAIVHTCTGSIPEYDLENWYNAVARNTRAHAKPAFNNESGREKRHKNDDGIHRRKQAWIFNTAGCYWTHHSWDGCEGINDTLYCAPGEEYLKPLSDFFQSIPFWTLNPNYTVLQINDTSLICNTLTDTDRKLSLVYICSRKTGTRCEQLPATLRLPDGAYTLLYRSPATMATVAQVPLHSEGIKRTTLIQIPAFTDDILLVITKTQAKAKTIIPGTE